VGSFAPVPNSNLAVLTLQPRSEAFRLVRVTTLMLLALLLVIDRLLLHLLLAHLTLLDVLLHLQRGLRGLATRH
jgi:hypothetical protein